MGMTSFVNVDVNARYLFRNPISVARIQMKKKNISGFLNMNEINSLKKPLKNALYMLV